MKQEDLSARMESPGFSRGEEVNEQVYCDGAGLCVKRAAAPPAERGQRECTAQCRDVERDRDEAVAELTEAVQAAHRRTAALRHLADGWREDPASRPYGVALDVILDETAGRT